MRASFWNTILHKGVPTHKSANRILIRYSDGEEELIHHWEYHGKCKTMDQHEREQHSAYWAEHDGSVVRRK